MLGGGTFTSQNKILPGTYVNVVSAVHAGSNATNGVVAMPLTLNWGPMGEVVKLTKEEFEKDSLKLLGYPKDAPEVLPIREIFRNAVTLYYYRTNSAPVKASNTYAVARYEGVRGNDLSVVIQKNVDDQSKYDVETRIGSSVYEIQTVATAFDLEDNEFLVFKKDATLAVTAGMPLTGGTNGSTATGEDYQNFLDQIESCTFNVLGCPTKDTSTINLFMAYTKRMRDEQGIKFQTVVYKAAKADYEGIISIENRVTGRMEATVGVAVVGKSVASGIEDYELVYWVSGAAAACALNRSITNKIYDGEYVVDTPYTQVQLESAIKTGKLVLHRVGDTVRVLRDINTLVTFTDEKNQDFADNQTIRILDAIGNNVAGIFSGKYMGQIPNDEAGRVSLWNDIVTYLKSLVSLRAVEAFEANMVTVTKGNNSKSVVASLPVTPINCMEQLYMTVIVN